MPDFFLFKDEGLFWFVRRMNCSGSWLEDSPLLCLQGEKNGSSIDSFWWETEVLRRTCMWKVSSPSMYEGEKGMREHAGLRLAVALGPFLLKSEPCHVSQPCAPKLLPSLMPAAVNHSSSPILCCPCAAQQGQSQWQTQPRLFPSWVDAHIPWSHPSTPLSTLCCNFELYDCMGRWVGQNAAYLHACGVCSGWVDERVVAVAQLLLQPMCHPPMAHHWTEQHLESPLGKRILVPM